MACAGSSVAVSVPRFRRVRPGSLARSGVLVCLVGLLAASGGGLTGRAAPAAHASGWSQLPLAARGPVAAAVASHDPRYRVSPAADGLTARNPAQRLQLRFSTAGVGVRLGAGELQLGLRSVGRGAVARRLAAVKPAVSSPNRTVYRRAGLSEWYANTTLGLEQGFTLQRRPAGRGELTFTVGLAGTLAAAATQRGQTVSFGSLAYRGLVVTDARGRTLPAHVRLARGRLLIGVDDRAARYPVRVDPFVQSAELIATDRAAGDNLGASVAVSGNTIVAGTPFHKVGGNTNQGAVYVFTEPSGGWSTGFQTTELTASDGAKDDNLGWSVAVSGDTIVAGAVQYNGGQAGQGAVYVFTEPPDGWTSHATATQTAELTAFDGATNDHLGWSVAVNGPTIAAGAPSHAVGDNAAQGAVYVYTRPAGGWTNATQTAELTASDGAANDQLGLSVALSADTIAAGSEQRAVGGHTDQGAVYVFAKPNAGWADATQTAELTASDGAAYDALGWTVAVSGDTIAAGAPGSNNAQGAVYVYTKPGGGWTDATQTAELSASDGAASDQLGSSVGVSSDTITAGAPQRTVGQHLAQGAVYVWEKPGGGWADGTQTSELTASDGASGDDLGASVAVSGSTIVAGSPRRSLNKGVLYVYSSGLSIATTQQPASATVGSKIADQATVSGGDSPTGTVTFRLYDNSSGTGPALFTNTASFAPGTTTATSAGYTTSATGTFYWVATYNGDDNNPSISSDSADEPVTVKAQPSVATTQQPASATVGASIADQATVSQGASPTGTVIFKLYDNASATGSPLFTDTEPLSNGSATSSGYPTTATGTYYWVATYNGDSNNFPTSSGTADEPVTLSAATVSISTTQQPASAAIGSSIADQADVSGGYNPTGTVTFDLYDNSSATGSPLYTDTESLSSGSATSAGYATTATGTYYWVATYNGDSNNNGASSGPADEPVTVTKATPSVLTAQLPASAAIGASIADKAVVSGGYNPTGTVTFDLYDNSNATGSPLYTDTEPLSSKSATSAGYVPTATGTYYWVATYNGDSDNNSSSSGTSDEPVTVSTAMPSVSTTRQPTTAEVGSSIADQATVTGGDGPTGTVTFRLYDNSTAAGSPLYSDTEPLSSGGANSASYSTALAGTFYWVATYDGDADNGVASSGSADEPVTVTKATPSLATKRLQKSAKVKKPIADKATVSGGFHPAGKVTFRLYKNRTAKGKPVFTSTKSLSHGKATSARYKPKKPGKYYWVVTYNGDANNQPVSSGNASQRVSVHR